MSFLPLFKPLPEEIMDDITSIIAKSELSDNPAKVYLASLNSPVSRRSMYCAIKVLAELLTSDDSLDPLQLPWEKLDYALTTALRARLASSGRKRTTINLYLSALKGIFRAAFNLELINADKYQRLMSIKSVTGEDLSAAAGRQLSQEELRQLFATCEKDKSPTGIRDRAILALLYGYGLRREEIVKLDLSHYTALELKLIIHGKRSKSRTGYLTPETAYALNTWLDMRGMGPGALFLPIRKNDAITHSRKSRGGQRIPARLTAQAIYYIIDKRTLESGINEKTTPHDFRRTFISDLLDAGIDLSTVRVRENGRSLGCANDGPLRPSWGKSKTKMYQKYFIKLGNYSA
jgi:site-specific recombinase XerD